MYRNRKHLSLDEVKNGQTLISKKGTQVNGTEELKAKLKNSYFEIFIRLLHYIL